MCQAGQKLCYACYEPEILTHKSGPGVTHWGYVWNSFQSYRVTQDHVFLGALLMGLPNFLEFFDRLD